MPTVHFLIPGDLSARTGGYEYDRRIAEGLAARGWTVEIRSLDRSFPQPTAAALERAGDVLAAIPRGATVIIDGLALGAMPDPVRAHAGRLDIVALIHHPLALETGIDRDLARRLRDSEVRALACTRHVVVTSPRTAATLGGYGVAAGRITVVEPGTDPAPVARGSADGYVRLVCVATLSPRKGHDILCRALAPLREQRWHLTCVGRADADAATTHALRALLAELEIGDRVDLVGEAESAATAAYYDESDAFVLATWYEGYGMAVAEALARGLPVVSTPTGAIPDLVGSDAGLLVAAGDVEGWTRALSRILDPAQRAVLAEGARRRRSRLPTWDQAAALLERALSDYV